MSYNNLKINGKKVLSVVLSGLLLLIPGLKNETKAEQNTKPGIVSFQKYDEESQKRKPVKKPPMKQEKEHAIMPEELSMEKVFTKKKGQKRQKFE